MAECETDQSLPSSAEVKNEWSYPTTPSYIMVWWSGPFTGYLEKFKVEKISVNLPNINIKIEVIFKKHYSIMNVLVVSVEFILSGISEVCKQTFCPSCQCKNFCHHPLSLS